MKTTRSLRPGCRRRAPARVKRIATRFSSLIVLFQRMPVIQYLFPEANLLGGAAVGNSFSLAVTTVVGLGAYDSVAGQTTIDQVTPIAKAGRDPASTSASYAVNVPATVSAPLNFQFTCTNAPSRPKSYSTTSLPGGLSLSWVNTATGVYNDYITGTPTTPGVHPVNITVWRSADNTSDSVTQRFNICVLGFTTQPEASTTLSSGQTTTLTCVATGNPTGTSWHPGNGTLTYEWYQGTSGTIGPVLGTSDSFITPPLGSSTSFWVRIKSVLGSSTVYANSNTATVIVTSPYDSWAGVLPADQRDPALTPQGDGVTNLEKFAFNLNPLAPDVRHLTAGASGETAGLPVGSRAGGVLRLEFLRRKASTSPGITFTAQFATNLSAWSDFGGVPASVTSVDTTWERVVVIDPTGGSMRFGRVKVIQSP